MEWVYFDKGGVMSINVECVMMAHRVHDSAVLRKNE